MRQVMSGRQAGGELIQWTNSSEERRELKRAAGVVTVFGLLM
jgi:hypothetical protein